MRYCQLLMLALGCAILIGCVSTNSVRNRVVHQTQSPPQAPSKDDAVQLLVAVIERPAGDPVLNEEIWKLADEQMKDLEKKSLLLDNGFRTGMFGTLPPPSLRDLIQSPRSCQHPHRLRLLASTPTQIQVGSVQPLCTFQLKSNTDTALVKLDQAECLLEVTANPLASGQTELQFTPIVRHGKPGLDRLPIRDPGDTLRWNMQVCQQVETYSHLSWTQAVNDSEYLVVGCWIDRPGTLGQSCFLEAAAPPPMQRLLVLRVVRNAQDAASSEENQNDSPPIAAQAGVPITIRGSGR
jgi:hypothetical protein